MTGEGTGYIQRERTESGHSTTLIEKASLEKRIV